MSTAAATLYENIGGALMVEAVTKEFYRRVLGDLELKGYFAATDVERFVRQQMRFISQALGGPVEYSGRPLREAHANLGVTKRHFDRIVGHLVGAFKSLGACGETVEIVRSIVAPMEGEIVTVR